MGEGEKAAVKNGGDKKNGAGAAAGPQPIVLKTDLHCHGCTRKIRKAIKRTKGVESVTVDMTDGKVFVTGPADAAEIKQRVEAKTKKAVEIVSAGSGPPNEEDKKVAATIKMHRKRCTLEFKGTMKGVVVDYTKDKVMVTGTVDDADDTPPDGEKDDGGGDEEKSGGDDSNKDNSAPKPPEGYYYAPMPQYGYMPFPPAFYYDNAQYPSQWQPHASHLYAPLLFSDENPSACSVM